MAPEPETNNPWTGLTEQARNGTLKVDSGAAREAAGFAAAAANAVELVKGYVPDVQNPSGFGNFESSYLLQSKFAKAAGDLEDILGRFLEILNAMGETFIVADKTYEESDSASDEEFRQLREDKQPGTAPTPPDSSPADTPYFGGGGGLQKPEEASDSGEFSKMEEFAGAKEGRDTTPIDVETPSHLMEPDFVSFKPGLDSSKVATDGVYWKWMSEQLDEAFGDLTNRLSRLRIDGSWEGDGIDGAIGAADTYRTQATALTESMLVLGQNMAYTSGWLSETKKYMPHGEYVDREGMGPDDEGDCLFLWHRRGFESWYVKGLGYTNSAIPILPSPTVDPADLPGSNGDGGNGDGGGSGGGGGGGGDRGGGGMPAAQAQQQAALQQIDQERAQLMAAQQQLEDQAQLQQAALEQQQQALGGQPGTQPMLQAAQQGLQQLGQMGQQLSTAAQQALQQAGITGLPGMPALQDAVKNYQSALQKAGKLPAGLGGSGAGGSSGAPGGAPKAPPAPNVEKAAKLFPRASLAATATGAATGVAAGPAGSGAPMGGMPMGGGAGGGAQGGGQQKDHKRADYLDSTEWLEEGIGDPSVVAKPVVDQ